MKELELQNVYNKTLVDDDIYERFKDIKLYAERDRVRCKDGYLHRLIMNVVDGALVIDHINGNGLDNRRANLRICTSLENARNHKKPSTNTSGFKGVRPCAGKYRAIIRVDGKNIHLGYFDTLEAGAKAYDEASKKYHGEFSSSNLELMKRKIPAVLKYKPTKYDDPNIRPGMVPLDFGIYAYVDVEDYDRTMKHGWSTNQMGYAHAFIDGKLVRLHRFVLDVKSDEIIDHINRNRLDCRKNNLRICSVQENSFNRTKQKNTSSKYKGVILDVGTRNKKWKVRISVNGKQIQLGRFYDETIAAIAYDVAAREYHGEFASLNFPDEA